MHTRISAYMYTLKLFNLVLRTLLTKPTSLLFINTTKLLESVHSLMFPKISKTAYHRTPRTQITWC